MPQQKNLPLVATEIPSARTAGSSTFLDPNGSKTSQFGTGLNVQTAPGVWTPADFTLVPSGPDLVAKNSSVPFKVTAQGVEATGSVSHRGIRWLTPSRPTVSDSAVSATLGGLDWQYRPTRAGLEFSAKVAAPQGRTMFQFGYTLLGGAAPLSVNGNGDLVSDGFSVSRAILVGADTTIFLAGAWQLLGNNTVGFSVDDSTIASGSYPYTIDPASTWPETGNVGNDAWDYLLGPGNPPSGGTPTLLKDQLLGNVALEPSGGTNLGVNELLAWNTGATLVSNTFVSGATLTVQSCSAVSVDHLSISADWDPYATDFAPGAYNLPLVGNALTATAIPTATTSSWNATGTSRTNCAAQNGGAVSNPLSFSLANAWVANPNAWLPSVNSPPNDTMLRFGVNAGSALTGTNQWVFMTAPYSNATPPTLSLTYYPAPYAVQAAANPDGSATVSWSNPAPTTSTATIYRNLAAAWTGGVYSNLSSVVPATATSAIVTNLAPNTAYSFYVFAQYSDGGSGVNGITSDPVSNTITTTAASAPTGGAVGPLEQLGGCTCGYSTQDSLGHSVNMATGDYWTSYTDLSIRGRGPGLVFTRTYNSLLAGSAGNGLGNGWTSDYLMNLSIGTTTTVVNQETGSQASFVLNGSTWTPPPRVLATLVHSGSNWIFTRKGTQIFTFDSSGKLLSLKDPNNNLISLTYSGSQLQTVADDAGRSLTVHWNGSGRISSVDDNTTSPKRTVTFHFDDGHANLTEVDDIGGGVSLFRYDAANNNLLTIRTPDQVATSTASTIINPTVPTGNFPLTNTYDGQHRVTTQSDFLGNPIYFDYTTYVSSTAVTYPGTVTNTVLETYQNGELTSKTTGYGSPITTGSISPTLNLAGPANWTYAYDPATLGLTSVTDPDRHTSTATYDAAGNKMTSTDALNHTTRYAFYNAFDEPGAIGDPKGVTTTYTYDASGNVTAIATPLDTSPGVSQTVGLSYSGAHNDLTAITDPNNHPTAYGYDTYGDVARTVDAAGVTTTYFYDAEPHGLSNVGLRTRVVSPRGNVPGGVPSQHTTTYTYDNFGDVYTQTDANNHTVTSTYTANRNLLTSTDANGAVTTYLYDGDGQRFETKLPNMAFTLTGYDVNHNVSFQQEPNGHGASYEYRDPAFPRKPTLMTVDRGSTQLTAYGYDAAGNLTNQTLGTALNCPCIANTYDAANELTQTNYTAGSGASFSTAAPNVSSIQYDPDGQRTTMTVVGQSTATWAYDSLHRVTSTRDGAANTVGYTYDLDGNVASTTYPASLGTVTRGYDLVGRLAAVTDTANAVTRYNYDPDSNLVSQLYPNATTATVTPDNAGQIVGITDTSTAAPGGNGFMSFTYTRGPTNQITQTVSTGVVPTDNHTYNYTALAQLSLANNAANSYDQNFNPVELASGAVQVYDPGDELTTASNVSLVGIVTATDTGGSGTLSLPLPVSATANDQVLVSVVLRGSGSVTTPAGYSVVTSTNTGNASSNANLVVLRHTVVNGDAATLTLSATAASPKVATAALYRGVSAASPIDASAAGSAGGATQVTTTAITASAPGDHLVALLGANTSGSPTWTVTSPAAMTAQVTPTTTNINGALWDGVQIPTGTVGGLNASGPSGDLVGALVALLPAPTSYTYVLGDRTKAVAPGVTTTMTYDPLNRLSSYVTATATSSGTTTYSYFGDGNRATKASAGGTTAYTWDQVAGTLLYDGTTVYIYGLGGVPLEQVSAGARLFYHQDQLGSTRALTNVTGTVVAAFSYDANGNPTATGTVTTPFGFTGQYKDAESGFVYLHARYYDPVTGQFLTRDPAYAQSGSAYGYAGNDPINSIDPSGLGRCLFGHVSDPNSQCQGTNLRNDLVVTGLVLGIAGSILGIVASAGTLSEVFIPTAGASFAAFTGFALGDAAAALSTAGTFLSAVSAASYAAAGAIDCSQHDPRCEGDFTNAAENGAGAFGSRFADVLLKGTFALPIVNGLINDFELGLSLLGNSQLGPSTSSPFHSVAGPTFGPSRSARSSGSVCVL